MSKPNWPSLSRIFLALLIVTAIVTLGPSLAHAAGATTMPWDSNITKISASFTGPFAYAITILGMVGAGSILIFAQEIPFFLKAICFIVLVGSFLCGANAFAATMGWTGAVV